MLPYFSWLTRDSWKEGLAQPASCSSWKPRNSLGTQGQHSWNRFPFSYFLLKNRRWHVCTGMLRWWFIILIKILLQLLLISPTVCSNLLSFLLVLYGTLWEEITLFFFCALPSKVIVHAKSSIQNINDTFLVVLFHCCTILAESKLCRLYGNVTLEQNHSKAYQLQLTFFTPQKENKNSF